MLDIVFQYDIVRYMQTNKPKEDNMETNNKPSDIANSMFDLSKSFTKISKTATMYARLNMILDMKLYLAKEEKEIREKIQHDEVI